jgi:hypothetical protein
LSASAPVETPQADPAAAAALAALTDRYRLSSGESLLEASRDRPLLLVFLRHFGCTFTRQILRGLEELESEASARGARIVLVHLSGETSGNYHLSRHRETARIADPDRALYRAFGLGRGGFFELFGPRVLWFGLLALIKGCGIGHLAGDGRQMPGAFLFQDGRVIAAQRARTAADMPEVSRLFAAAAQQIWS